MADIPRLPGVPNLSSFSANPIILLIEDVLLPAIFGEPVWGIFLDGVAAFDFNSVVGFDFKRDWSISDYQVEEGGFQSYDKVQLPGDARLRFSSGGTAAERQALLNEAAVLCDSLDLYDIVTPEIVYTSYNPSHYDYHRRADSGVGMIVIDIWFTEVRVSAAATFTQTQQPTGAGRENVGTVQSQTPPNNVFTPNLSFF